MPWARTRALNQCEEIDMTIEIPVWLLWTLGIGLGVPTAVAASMFVTLGFLIWRDWK